MWPFKKKRPVELYLWELQSEMKTNYVNVLLSLSRIEDKIDKINKDVYKSVNSVHQNIKSKK